MNCPFCKTHIDEHEANRCADAWVAKLKGHRLIEETIGVEGSESIIYRIASINKYDHTVYDDIPHYTTSLDVFMAEVMTVINKRGEFYIGIIFDVFRKTDEKYSVYICQPTVEEGLEYKSYGKTINEALFRTSVKVLRERLPK